MKLDLTHEQIDLIVNALIYKAEMLNANLEVDIASVKRIAKEQIDKTEHLIEALLSNALQD